MLVLNLLYCTSVERLWVEHLGYTRELMCYHPGIVSCWRSSPLIDRFSSPVFRERILHHVYFIESQ